MTGNVSLESAASAAGDTFVKNKER